MDIKTINNEETTGRHHNRPTWQQPSGGGLYVGDLSRHNRWQLPDPAIVIRGEAIVTESRDVFFAGVIGASNRTVTVTFRPSLVIDAGCFHGTLDQFSAEVAMKPEGSRDRVEYEALVELLKVLEQTRCPPSRSPGT